MIQIYSPSNTNFSMNGDSVLFPESCDTIAKLNGEWYMDIQHPRDEEGRWKYIVEEAVISAPTFMGKKQLFRIDDVEKSDDGVNAKAYPIFFDSADDLFVYSCKPTFVSGQKALDMLMSGTKYSGESNITKTNSAEFTNRNLMDCINGDAPAFIRYWGGDVLYDNYKVIINSRAGSNRGFQIRYRRNMDGISRKVDMSNVVTRIVPVAYNGRMITNKYVDSPNIGKYAKVYIRLMEFPNVKLAEDASEEEAEGITVCATQTVLNTTLTSLCNEQFNTGIDLPNTTLNVDMVDLSGTEEYKGFTNLETVSLGDTVGVYHRDLGISTEERVIEITWDSIRNKATKLTLGDYEYDYLIDGNKAVLDKAKENYLKALEEWKAKYEEIKNKYAKVESDMSEFGEELGQVNSNLSDLGTDFDQMEQDISDIEGDMGQLEDYVVEELEDMQAEIAAAREEIRNKLNSTSGMYTTKQRQSNGSYIYYFHDQPKLESSTNIWKMTSESFSVSTDGGKTYSYGITVDGDAILNRLDLKKLFSKEITATNLTLTGASKFISEDEGKETRITIEEGVMIMEILAGDAQRAEHSGANSIYYAGVYHKDEDDFVTIGGAGLSFGSNIESQGLSIRFLKPGLKGYTGEEYQAVMINRSKIYGYDNAVLDWKGTVKFKNSDLIDFVVEQGISGIWNYRKWASGIAECWGRREFGNVYCNTEYYGTYYGSAIAINFPSGLFSEAPSCQCTAESQYVWVTHDKPTAAKFPVTYYYSPQSGTYNVSVNLYAVGKWK